MDLTTISASASILRVPAQIDKCHVEGLQFIAEVGEFVQNLSWKLSDDLDELHFEGHSSGLENLFNSRWWVDCWIETVARDNDITVKILTGSVAEKTIIAMPLAIKSYRFTTGVQFIAQDVSDYNGILIHQELAQNLSPQLVNKIIEHVGVLFPNADYIDLRKSLLGGFSPLNGKVRWQEDPDQAHHCTLSGDWEKDFSQFIGRTSRRSLKRKLKKLKSIGEVTFGEIETHQAKEHAIGKLCEWKEKQLEELGSANIFSHGPFNNFMKSTVQDSSSLARLFGMFIDGKPIALIHMICSPKRWFLYQTAYTSEEEGKYSPGFMLLLNVMEEACRKGVPIFDFGWGNEPYKLRFASQSLPLHHAFLPLSLKGHFIYISKSLMGRVKKFIKSNAHARSAATFVLRIMARAKAEKV